ncbi:Cytochrome P450, E-class, group I [Parasponia andersonii]|uniref:Cytochrome P450, E-class, group I n=1 Tax=Parasponia andersonii TaxID=3476 RepID=A0A2P5BZI7_PARAD|nr:Cytochrome P450, E-class, group I [Parasponia andersonii]
MYRPVWIAPSRPQRWHDSWAGFLTPLILWICVSVTLRYGYYGDCRMVLGPSSSRLVKTSSYFVQQVQVRDHESGEGVFLYAFNEKPELSSETNWSVSKYLIVGSHARKGFSLWLNKGSRISLRLEAQSSSLTQLEAVMSKGERNYKTMLRKLKTTPNALTLDEPIKGKEVEYAIEEDDRYYLDIVNSNFRSVIITLKANFSSKMYDITKANNKCSTTNGSCRLRLLFPDTRYVILTTPNNGHLDGWYLEISFVARVITYIAVLGFITIFIFIFLKYFGACDGDEIGTPVEYNTVHEITETHPIMPEKPIRCTYGTADQEEDDDSDAYSSSSEELYDAKLCVICYDDQRNCFYVPCGHCATCYDCAQRIMDGESKVCPICRRLIHKYLPHKNRGLPPSPAFSLPIIGHLHLLKKPLHRTLAKLSDQYGPVLHIQFGTRHVVLVSSPSVAEECFTKNDIAFANRPTLLAGKHLGYNYATLTWASNGPHWRNLRRIASMELLSSNRLQMLYGVRLSEIRSLIRQLFQSCQGGEFRTVEMKSTFFELTLNVVMRMIAGKR